MTIQYRCAVLNTASQVNLGSTFKTSMSSSGGGGEAGGGEGSAADAGTVSTSTTAAGEEAAAAAASPAATTTTATEGGAANPSSLTVGRGDAANPASTAMGGGPASPASPASPEAGASTKPASTNTSAVPPSSADNVHKATDILNPKRMQRQIDDLQRQREVAMEVVVKNGGIDPQQLAMVQQMVAAQQTGLMQQMMGWGAMPQVPLVQSPGTERRRGEKKSEAIDASQNITKQDSSSDARTLDDYKQGEMFYRELCGEKDKQIVCLEKEVEDKKTVIDRLRAQLVRGLELVAVRNAAGGETNAAPAADAKHAAAKDGKLPGRAKKKRSRSGKQENATAASTGASDEGEPAPKRRNLAKASHLDSERQRQYRAKLEENWNAKIQQLTDFLHSHGHCNVPMRCKENPTLGAWLNKQRECYRAVLRGAGPPGGPPRISDARIAQLDALGLCWNVRETRDGAGAERLADRAWNANARALAAYREEHGDCVVPHRFPADPGLANFVARARRAFKRQQEYRAAAAAAAEGAAGGASAGASAAKPAKGMPAGQWLTQPRIEWLDELGFTWSIRDAPVDIWNERYERLRAYKEKFGHCRVPVKYDKVLNQWILSQRFHYKNTMDEDRARNKKHGKLSAEKIVRLQRLGFEWEVQEKVQEEAWEARFRDLLRFRAERGHCRVPKQHPPNTKLSHWVYEQRKNHKSLRTGSRRGRRGLTDERIRRLEEVGFEWSVLPAKTEAGAEDEGAAVAGEWGHALAHDDPPRHYPPETRLMEADDEQGEAAAAAGEYEAGGYDHSWMS